MSDQFSMKHTSYGVAQIFADPDALDKLIAWKMASPRVHKKGSMSRHTLTEEQLMQRQFTVELRVDYADSAKNDAMKIALQAAARHIYATALLLADDVKP